MRVARNPLIVAVLAGLGGCASTPVVTQAVPELMAMPETHTVMGRYPARRSGILIAQNAALAEGRAMCQAQKLRFRPVGSVAGEDPSNGDAVYAVRFMCLPGRRAQVQGIPNAEDQAQDDAP